MFYGERWSGSPPPPAAVACVTGVFAFYVSTPDGISRPVRLVPPGYFGKSGRGFRTSLLLLGNPVCVFLWERIYCLYILRHSLALTLAPQNPSFSFPLNNLYKLFKPFEIRYFSNSVGFSGQSFACGFENVLLTASWCHKTRWLSLGDAESQPQPELFLSSWCHSHKQPPASQSRQQGGEVSHCAGLPAAELYSESSRIHLFQTDRRERAAEDKLPPER